MTSLEQHVPEHEVPAVQIPGAPPGVTMRAVWVTPELAAKWLAESRTRQRSKRTALSDAYGRDMAENRWKFNGETVVFDKSHNLMQGQHRMEGVEKGGKPVLLLLVEGVEPDVMDTFDTGLPRYYFDMLKVAGYSYPAAMASVTRGMWNWDRGRYMMQSPGGTERPSRTELDGYLEAHHDAVAAAAAYAEKARIAVPLPVSVIGTGVIILNRIDQEKTADFFARLYDGSQMRSDNPVLVLRNQLSRTRNQRRYTVDERRALLFGTWNAWRAGESRDRIQPWVGQLTSRNYPIPK